MSETSLLNVCSLPSKVLHNLRSSSEARPVQAAILPIPSRAAVISNKFMLAAHQNSTLKKIGPSYWTMDERMNGGHAMRQVEERNLEPQPLNKMREVILARLQALLALLALHHCSSYQCETRLAPAIWHRWPQRHCWAYIANHCFCH